MHHKHQPLKFSQVSDAFIVLVYGLSLSIVVFIGELIYFYCYQMKYRSNLDDKAHKSKSDCSQISIDKDQ